MDIEPKTKSAAELEAENQRLRRAVEELSTLNAIGTAIGSTMSLNSIVELIVQESVKYMDVEQGAVMLLRSEEENDPFRTMARKAYSGSDAVPYRFGQQLTGWMLKNQTPLLINDLQSDPRFKNVATEDFPMHSLLSVPLRAKGEMVGLLNLFNKRTPGGFTPDDQRLLSIIASQSAQIVENVRLYEELQRQSAELQESETKYRSLMQEAGEAILLADFGTRRILKSMRGRAIHRHPAGRAAGPHAGRSRACWMSFRAPKTFDEMASSGHLSNLERAIAQRHVRAYAHRRQRHAGLLRRQPHHSGDLPRCNAARALAQHFAIKPRNSSAKSRSARSICGVAGPACAAGKDGGPGQAGRRRRA